MACAMFLKDPSPRIVSTAALLMASLIDPPGGADMAGREAGSGLSARDRGREVAVPQAWQAFSLSATAG